jgi:hypothetical protein
MEHLQSPHITAAAAAEQAQYAKEAKPPKGPRPGVKQFPGPGKAKGNKARDDTKGEGDGEDGMAFGMGLASKNEK